MGRYCIAPKSGQEHKKHKRHRSLCFLRLLSGERCRGSAGIEKLAPHDLRRTCTRLCHFAGGELDQIQFPLTLGRVTQHRRRAPRSPRFAQPFDVTEDLFRLVTPSFASWNLIGELLQRIGRESARVRLVVELKTRVLSGNRYGEGT